MIHTPNITPFGDLYMITNDYTIAGITIPEYFTFDGCSIPGFNLFRPRIIIASLVHDWLYVTHQVTRQKADQIFKDLLILRGVSKVIASTMYYALRVGGAFAWDHSKKDIRKLELLYQLIKNNKHFKSYCFPMDIFK